MKFDKKFYLAFSFCILLFLMFLLNKKTALTNNAPNNPSDFIVQISSSVGKISFKTSETSAAKSSTNFPENLYNNSELKTFDGSNAQLSFENGWVIDLNADSEAIFQVWNTDNQQKYLLHLLSGSYELISKGTEAGLLVLYKNNFYSPGSSFTEKKSISLEITAKNISDLKKSKKINSPQQIPEDLKQKQLSKDEMSTRYIEASIFKKRHLFEKCLANRIRENNIISGRLLVGFNVTELGHLKNISIIDNKTQDKKIESCIIDVFTRIKVRNYNGPKIFFAFPVDFK